MIASVVCIRKNASFVSHTKATQMLFMLTFMNQVLLHDARDVKSARIQLPLLVHSVCSSLRLSVTLMFRGHIGWITVRD